MYAGHFDFALPPFWTVPDVLSADECARLVRQADAHGWLAATVNGAAGRVVDDQLRSNTIALYDDPTLAPWVWSRLLAHIPQSVRGRTRVGLKERLRCYRYEAGQSFGPHHDQPYVGPNGTRSELTLLIYLNHDFVGGATEFLDLAETVTPKAGTALVFQHAVLHEGCRVESGTKYVLRTDILYRD